MVYRSLVALGVALAMVVTGVTLAPGCSGGAPPAPAPEPGPAAPQPVPPAPAAPARGPDEVLPTLILTQARFEKIAGKTTPKPATLWFWRTDGTSWFEELVEDPESNVFHKGVAWRGGVLTIGAMKARLTHWTRKDGAWTPNVLWERKWGGKFDRLRDLEFVDVDGDGKEEIALATHDMGVVALGREGADGAWTFLETPVVADTFVHEIEVGDVDGDGKEEFYATPSERNKSSGASQPGGVARYDLVDGALKVSPVVQWAESHAKEILVADVDGDGQDELYAVREAHVEVTGTGPDKVKNRLEPVKIVQLIPKGSGWEEKVVATLDDDQCRFLVAGDLDRDGLTDLVAAGKDSGLWLLRRREAGAELAAYNITADSGGFEHAIHATDLDGDGALELYVASDTQGELRRYTWDGSGFVHTVIARMPPSTITWGIQDGRF